MPILRSAMAVGFGAKSEVADLNMAFRYAPIVLKKSALAPGSVR
jgi:hypothetical protein